MEPNSSKNKNFYSLYVVYLLLIFFKSFQNAKNFSQISFIKKFIRAVKNLPQV